MPPRRRMPTAGRQAARASRLPPWPEVSGSGFPAHAIAFSEPEKSCSDVAPRTRSADVYCGGLRLVHGGDLGALLLDGGGELLRVPVRGAVPTAITRARKAGSAMIARMSAAMRCLISAGDLTRAVDAGDAVEGEIGIAGLARGRHVRRLRRALAVGHQQQFRACRPGDAAPASARRCRRHAAVPG